MRARAECGSSKRASGQLTIIVRGGAWLLCLLSALLHCGPFPADHLLEYPLPANDGSRLLGGVHRGMLGLCSHPLLENRLCSECRRFAFPSWLLWLHLRLRPSQHPAPSDQLSGSVTHTEPFKFAIFYMVRHQSRWAQRVPSDPGPCHACRDEGGHLVAHLGQGLGSCISARQANKATVGPVPCPCRNDALDASANLNAWAREQRAEDRRYA